jgi:hypothetical protein
MQKHEQPVRVGSKSRVHSALNRASLNLRGKYSLQPGIFPLYFALTASGA